MTSSIPRLLSLLFALTIPRAPSPLSANHFAGPAVGAALETVSADAAASAEPRVEAFSVPGSSLHRVRATIAIDAPIERVRTVVFDFPRYPEFMAGYTRATVIRSEAGGSRVVQMELEELGGAIRLWMRVAISGPTRAAGVESYRGSLLQGNVKAFETRWELASLEPSRTRLTVESFVDPDLSLVPSSMVNKGARDGIRAAAIALKRRAEGR
jgi:hypothetical protein